MAKTKDPAPSEAEYKLLQALLYDSLLHGVPLVAHNVRSALADLLIHLGRPKLAELVKTM